VSPAARLCGPHDHPSVPPLRPRDTLPGAAAGINTASQPNRPPRKVLWLRRRGRTGGRGWLLHPCRQVPHPLRAAGRDLGASVKIP